jgi:excisionase family DNA binding protein
MESMAGVEPAADRYSLGVSEAADLLGVHPSTIRDYVDRGLLACRRTLGGHRRFRRSDLEALLAPVAPDELDPPPADGAAGAQ